MNVCAHRPLILEWYCMFLELRPFNKSVNIRIYSLSFLALMHYKFLVIKLITQIPKTTTTHKNYINKTANIL